MFIIIDAKTYIAREDIVVYKAGVGDEEEFVPYFRKDFTYTVDEECERVELVERRTEPKGLAVIHAGYHSASLEYITKYIQRGNEGVDIGVFVIPKGAFLYERKLDKTKECHLRYVSSSIIYKGLL